MWKRVLAALLLVVAAFPAGADYEVGDIICESSTTTGTGTLNLDGAVTNYLSFASQLDSGDTTSYHITASDGKLETGIGTFTNASPDTLSRTADWSTDGAGAELTLPSGTHTVCVGPIDKTNRGSLVLLTSGSVSSAATLDIVLTSYTYYRGIVVEFTHLVPATDGVEFWMRPSTDGGSTYITTDLWHGSNLSSLGGGVFATGGTGDSAFEMVDVVGNQADVGLSGRVTVWGQTLATWQEYKWQFSVYRGGGDWRGVDGGGIRFNTAEDHNALRFMFSSGNIASGSYAVYGIIY